MSQFYQQVNYGLTQALINNNPTPVLAKRNPTTRDVGYALGTLWVNVPGNLSYVLTSVVNNSATWTSPATSGAITATGLTVVGTTNINASGAAVTTIGTGGTGAVNIGNTTGNTAVTGSMTVSNNITATAGNISATAGSISAGTSVTAGTTLTATIGNITATDGNVVLSTASTYISLPGPVFIRSGAGAPAGALALHIGDIYTNTTAASPTTRLYIATAVGTWTNVTCAA